MQRRILVIPGIVLVLMGGLLVAANNVLESPLSSPEGSEPVTYVREQSFSNPGVAGMRRFGNSCSGCHGERGGGTDKGPSLLNKNYARNFRNSEAFHSAVGQAIAAHSNLLAQADQEDKERFNNLELMGKFLREARRQELIDREQQDTF